jgi:hypothetical protein
MAYPPDKRSRNAVHPSIAKFATGGCLDYANALMDWDGGKLYVVSRHSEPQHFVVRRDDGLFHDVFGAHTRQEVLGAWADILGGTVFLRRAKRADELGIETDEERYEEALQLVQSGPHR